MTTGKSSKPSYVLYMVSRSAGESYRMTQLPTITVEAFFDLIVGTGMTHLSLL